MSADQDQANILNGGVHIPQLVVNKAGGIMADLANVTKDDSFEIGCKFSS